MLRHERNEWVHANALLYIDFKASRWLTSVYIPLERATRRWYKPESCETRTNKYYAQIAISSNYHLDTRRFRSWVSFPLVFDRDLLSPPRWSMENDKKKSCSDIKGCVYQASIIFHLPWTRYYSWNCKHVSRGPSNKDNSTWWGEYRWRRYRLVHNRHSRFRCNTSFWSLPFLPRWEAPLGRWYCLSIRVSAPSRWE